MYGKSGDNILGMVITSDATTFCSGEQHMWIITDITNPKAFLNRFEERYSVDEINNTVHKPSLTYYVDFYKKLFVDGRDEPFHYDYSIPLDWKYYRLSPYFFTPNSIRKLWLNKVFYNLYDSAERFWIIDEQTVVGIIKLNNKWRIFFEMPQVWNFDFDVSEILPDYFSKSTFSDLRRDLPKVNDDNFHLYLQMLEPYELNTNQITNLAYNNHRKQFRPAINYIIDFDSKTFIESGFEDSILSIYTPTRALPTHWRYLPVNNRKIYDFLPDFLKNIWLSSGINL